MNKYPLGTQIIGQHYPEDPVTREQAIRKALDALSLKGSSESGKKIISVQEWQYLLERIKNES